MNSFDYGLRAAEAIPGVDPYVLKAIAWGSVDATEVMDSCEQWIALRLRQAQTNLDIWSERAASVADVREKLTAPEPQWVERWRSFG